MRERRVALFREEVATYRSPIICLDKVLGGTKAAGGGGGGEGLQI